MTLLATVGRGLQVAGRLLGAAELEAMSKREALALARRHGAVVCEGRWGLAKYYADDDLARARPYELVESEPNLLLTSGANGLWERLIGTAVVTFSNTNARIAVGDGNTAVAAGQTDLQGATKTRKLVDAAATVSGNQITFVATFTTADANHAWNEAGVANAGSGGVMLNRVVQSFGTKTGSLQWVMTAILTLS